MIAEMNFRELRYVGAIKSTYIFISNTFVHANEGGY